MSFLSQARLKELIDYCPDTGLFHWKFRPGDTRSTRSFNSRFPGKIAGTSQRCGRVIIWIDGKNYLAHRLAWLFMTGRFPKRLIDHCNCRPGDNRFSNLREATSSQNGTNKHGRAVTGFKGVVQHRPGRFVAYIKRDKKTRNLGSFATPEAAHAAYIAAAIDIYGEFARA